MPKGKGHDERHPRLDAAKEWTREQLVQKPVNWMEGLSKVKLVLTNFVAVGVALATLGISFTLPFYDKKEGEALAQTMQQQVLPQLQDLRRKSLEDNRQYWCGQTQIANARLTIDQSDIAAIQLRNIAISELMKVHRDLGYGPPPVVPPPGPVC